jgi:hypothetical protein
MQDASGSTSAITLSCSSSLEPDVIAVDAEALAAIIAPLSGAVLTKIRIRYRSGPSEPVTASGSAPITRAGAFFFTTADDNPLAVTIIRALKDEFIVETGFGDGVLIDTSASPIEDLVTALIDGGYTNVFADDITGLAAAYLQSRI